MYTIACMLDYWHVKTRMETSRCYALHLGVWIHAYIISEHIILHLTLFLQLGLDMYMHLWVVLHMCQCEIVFDVISNCAECMYIPMTVYQMKHSKFIEAVVFTAAAPQWEYDVLFCLCLFHLSPCEYIEEHTRYPFNTSKHTPVPYLVQPHTHVHSFLPFIQFI